MAISRREFHTWLAAAAAAENLPGARAGQTGSTGSHIGSLYPFVQKQADRSPLELSFLRPEFSSLPKWQPRARALLLEHLFYAPTPVAPETKLIRRVEHEDFFEEHLTFQTTPDLRVPAIVVLPKRAKLPAPGIVALHDHGGFYLWGKEKLLEQPGEHPELTAFRREAYGGRSVLAELARRGYVAIAIDMFYWGERRMLLDGDPPEFRDRPADMPKQRINEFNSRSGQNEQLVARSLLTAGISWPGVMLWDDIRTVDYLASRPEVDAARLGCVGLSVGGYRSFLLPALDERIKAAVDVCWMTSYASQIRNHIIHTVGLTFHIPGIYRYLDLPDLAALIAPRSVMVINGSRDDLFTAEGIQGAHDKIRRCYEKAGAADHQKCRTYDAPHEFNTEMQANAWDWLQKWLSRTN
jgi:dienelactone hydrolase